MERIALASWLVLMSACAPVAQVFVPTLEPQEEIALPIGASSDIRGFTRDAETASLFVAFNGLMTHTDAEGNSLSPFEQPQLPATADGSSRNIADLAAVGDEQFVLIASDDGHIWDRTTNATAQRFCVAPSIGPSEWQENGAVAVDVDADVIAAAPRFYEREPDPFGQSWETIDKRVEQTLRIYRLSDGELLSAGDLAHIAEDVEGLAFDDDAAVLWAAAGTQLHEIDREGALVRTFTLGGTESARGLARDGPRLWVIDGATNVVRIYDVNDAR